MTFIERYRIEKSWQGKAQIMEIYHLAQCARNKKWTLGLTAEYFAVSIGLTSENIRLAERMHNDPILVKCPTRYQALNRMDYK